MVRVDYDTYECSTGFHIVVVSEEGKRLSNQNSEEPICLMDICNCLEKFRHDLTECISVSHFKQDVQK